MSDAENPPRVRLCLFVAGAAQRSRRAIANLHKVLQEAPSADVEIIDIYQQPDRTRASDVLVAPCLIREWPGPPERLIGDLSNLARVRNLIGVGPEVAS